MLLAQAVIGACRAPRPNPGPASGGDRTFVSGRQWVLHPDPLRNGMQYLYRYMGNNKVSSRRTTTVSDSMRHLGG